MRIIIPVSHVDQHRLTKLTQVMHRLGGLEGYRITFAATPAAMGAVVEAKKYLDDHYVSPEVDIMETPIRINGWPGGSNAQFGHVSYELAMAQNITPFLWMEPDCVPLVRGWANKIHYAYQNSRAKFMGYMVPVSSVQHGVLTHNHNDKMMMGVGVYPGNFSVFPFAQNLLLTLKSGAIREPFDVYLRGFMKAQGVQHTELIGNRWRTAEYVNDDKLSCSTLTKEVWETDYSNTDISQAVMIHGCKDDTLADIILLRSVKTEVDSGLTIESAKIMLESNGYIVTHKDDAPKPVKIVPQETHADLELPPISGDGFAAAIEAAKAQFDQEEAFMRERDARATESISEGLGVESMKGAGSSIWEPITPPQQKKEEIPQSNTESAEEMAKKWKHRIKDPKEPFPPAAVIGWEVDKFYRENPKARLKVKDLMDALGVDTDGKQQFYFKDHLEKCGFRGKTAPFVVKRK